MSTAATRRVRRLWPWGIALFGLGFVISALANWPLRALPALAVPGLVPVGGTIWHGEWRYAPPERAPLVIDTRFVPSTLGWQATFRGPGISGQALLQWRGQRQKISSLHATVDLAAEPLLWQPAGTLVVHGDLTLAGGVVQTAALTGQWQNARITTTEPLALGAFEGHLAIEQGQLRGKINAVATDNPPLRAELDLSGAWPLTAPPRATGFVQPTATASPALRAQLGLLGTADANGRIALNGVLPLP